MNALPELREQGRLGTERLSSPLVVDLDPTTVCDLACPECISADVLHNGQLGRDRIVRLAEELAGSEVRAVILIGGGEPLLHRSIGEVMEVLHGAGIDIGLVTNGTQIRRHLDRLAETVSWVRVSMDAGTEATYGRFRPGRGKRNHFSQVIENMRLLAERKSGRIGYSFLLMQRFDAEGQVVDSNFKAMLDDDHFMVNQRAEDIALVEEQLDRLRELEDPGFHLLSSSNWEAVRVGADSVQDKDCHRCHVAELRTTVTPSGVYVCPYHRGNEGSRIGDISNASFAETWAAADTTAIDPNRDCRFGCARNATNLTVAGLRDRTGTARLADDFDPFI
ncbi:radical SAM protein [Streptomyces sp. GESEQ-4]|uniref:radical SAM protein n=1 Tax=Streptomyces sp. GESEQ-4 TaxID=2812655 RepID=UPI001B31A7CF|nr:radical SAM protein [Streptomyces sp. GESEQ-4]